MKLGELLLEARLITSEQLAEALRLQAANRRRHLGDILVDMGVVTVRQIHMALADKLGIPFVNVREFRVDPLALELLSAGAAARYRALPLVQMGDSLVVAVENPLAMDFVQELRVLTGRIIVPVIANPADLRLRIAKEYASLELAAPPSTLIPTRCRPCQARVWGAGTSRRSMWRTWRARWPGKHRRHLRPKTMNPTHG